MTRLLFFLLTLLFSVSADPSGFGGGLNFYAYANANPVSYLDLFGLGALESGTGGSWLNQALEGTAMGDWSKGFSSGLGSYVSGENLNRYTPTGSQAYQNGVTSGYGAVPNAMELANVALTMSAVGAAVSAETMVGESAASETAAAAETTATQLEFPFARGASVQTPGVTTAGETFVRVASTPERLNFSFNGAGGALRRTYAMPEATFNAIGGDPAALQRLLDLPGHAPVYYRYLQPPPGTLIQRGVVPGGEFGGVGGVPEVRFPKGF